jgi:hypothetical protein
LACTQFVRLWQAEEPVLEPEAPPEIDPLDEVLPELLLVLPLLPPPEQSVGSTARSPQLSQSGPCVPNWSRQAPVDRQ